MKVNSNDPICGIDHIHVVSNDVNTSVRFYTRLGFRLVRQVAYEHPSGSRTVAYMMLGSSCPIEIVQPFSEVDESAKGYGAKNMPFALTVSDIEASVKKLTSAGATLFMAPKRARTYDGWVAIVTEPGGGYVELRQWEAGDHMQNDQWQPQETGVVRTA